MPRLPARVPCQRRHGIILLVVVVLLALFAAVGLAFVLYAESEASAARAARESETLERPDLPPQVLLNHFLGQLLYDVPDDNTGVYSALRGHSLARLLYGYGGAATGNDQPFNGTGRLHGPSPFPGVDDYRLVNYTFFPADGFLRDPERLGPRPGPAAPRGPYTGGFNAPYTFPDLYNLFLAAVTADGTVLTPSYHRPWLFGPLEDRSNPNWTGPVGKYLLLRPRPADMGAGFPYPEDAGGDVKNLVGAPGGNDSVWLDLGFPVLTTPDGRKYRPLFAALVTDLDNRVNVNVHGNVRGAGQAHASDQGWGPWEVSVGRVLGGQSGPGEWSKLFVGTATPPVAGRYGGPPKGGQVPGPGLPPNNVAAALPPPHFYAPIDYDASNERAAGAASGALRLPADVTAGCFPAPPAGYGNASLPERFNHPLLYNVFHPAGDDRAFTARQMEALLRAGDTGAAALASDLLRLCPTSFAAARARRLVTTHSFDRDVAGVTPWLYDPGLSGYAVPGGSPDAAPAGPPLPFPPLNLRPGAPPPGSDFRADWRAARAAARLDLNQPLPPFPHQRTGTVPPFGPAPADPYGRFDDPAVSDQYLEALLERQRLADQVYRLLLAVTGVPPAAVPAAPTDAELAPRRWLAQLAANLVDFVDDDDIPTPFNFYTEQDAYPNGRPAGVPPFDIGAGGSNDLPRYWVFGVELPHVLLNEVLAEYQEPAVPVPGGGYDVRVWAELHNPFQVPPPGQGFEPRDGLPVALQVPALPPGVASAAPGAKPDAFASYQVVVANQLLPRPVNDNVLGNPDQVRCSTADTDFAAAPPTAGGAPQAPSPTGVPAPYLDLQGGATNSPFFLLGPPGPDAHNALTPVSKGGTVPDVTPFLQSANLAYRVTYGPGTPPSRSPDDRATGVTVLLRRLANPHLPHDPRPSVTLTDGEVSPNPWYNPYLTVDYLEQVPLRNATDPTVAYASRGKRQPYAAHRNVDDNLSWVADQSVPNPPSLTQHTFGQPNNPAPPSGRYDWLVHLDRQTVNPMELLQAAACPPYQLTHAFMGDVGGPRFTHRAPWFDESRRLYRLLEFLDTTDRTGGAGAGGGGRVAGRVNLNTVWDPETLLALADAQPANAFTDADVQAAFAQLLALRTPGGAPGPADRPLLPLSTGPRPPGDVQYPRGSGIDDTLLRSFDGAGGARRLFEPAADAGHPYLQEQLLTKLFGNVTTRSNVFAVWVTVGFFEVTDATARPVRLGPELGRADGRQRRHRFFALVDRSGIGINPRPVSAFDYRQDPVVLFVSVIE